MNEHKLITQDDYPNFMNHCPKCADGNTPNPKNRPRHAQDHVKLGNRSTSMHHLSSLTML